MAGMTMAFVTMSMAEIFHSLNMRSQRGSIFTLKTKNVMLFGAAALSFVLTTAVVFIPVVNSWFGFAFTAGFEFLEYVIAMGIAALMIPCVEIVKLVQRKIAKNR